LYAVPVSRCIDTKAVYKCSVGRAEITQERLWRSYLNNAVMARKETVVGQTELRILASADHERVVLFE
jgi:hypothetical protein